MRVTVSFHHVDPSEGLRSYAMEKVARLGKFTRRATDAHVVLTVEKQRHRAEIQLLGRDLHLVAASETNDLYSAIDLVLDKLERQLKKTAGKARSRKGSLPKSAVLEPAPRRRTRLRPKRVRLREMSVDEAIDELEADGAAFLLFHNPASDSLCVLCRQKDGSLSLLEPEVG